MGFMNQTDLRKINARIEKIRNAAEELRKFSRGIPAVNRNAERIIASTKMLEINISDILKLLR